MKRFLAAILALVLLLACAACGGKETPSAPEATISGGGAVGEQREEPSDRPGDPAEPVPQAEEALVREIVLTYGAYEDTLNTPSALAVGKKSLFLREEGWEGALTPAGYLYWVDSLPMTEEEWNTFEAAQTHAQGREGESPFGYRFFPPELVEDKVLSHFDTTLDQLQSDPECYDGSVPGYFLPAGGGMGSRITVSYTYAQDGETLTVPVTLTWADGSEPAAVHTLTVRLEPDGGWKYLGCQVA